MPNPNNPLYEAAKKFFENWSSGSDVTDKVPLGTPPVSEHPSSVTPNNP
jgi:hypothetical protein